MERAAVDGTPWITVVQLPQIQADFRPRSLREEASRPWESEVMKETAYVKE